jgi:acyl-CoA thioester hydrolase
MLVLTPLILTPGTSSTVSSLTRIRVRYAETDQMGVVYYANYLVWMEVARVDYCQAAGFRYKDLEIGHGILLAVTEANCRYLSPARYDEEVEIVTTLPTAHRRALTFHYEMRSAATGTPIARGHTSHMFLNRDLRPTTLPPQFRSLLGIPERRPE